MPGTENPRGKAAATDLAVVGLKVDYADHPLGLENPHPQLSWRLESARRNTLQSAYRILVASSEEILRDGRGDLWNSGRVRSGRTFGIAYQGRELLSRQRCWWHVQIWDDRGEIVPPSAVSWWEMGLLHRTDWTAQWLAIEDREIRLDRETGLHWIWGSATDEDERAQPRRFRFRFGLPVAALDGEFFALVKEQRVGEITGIWVDGEAVPVPASDNLSGRRLRLDALRAGEHLIAIEVRPSPIPLHPNLAAIPNLKGLSLFARIELRNGETLRLTSGPHWKTSLGQAQEWFAPGHDDGAWEGARALHVKGHQAWPPLPAMNLRRRFFLDAAPTRARLYATALGAYEARINGGRVGDALLMPEISQYAKHALYRVFDVTQMLGTGENVVALTVGDGWYASFDGRFAWGPPPRRVIAQLEMTFSDGSREIVETGPDWRITHAPVRQSECRVGEIRDARLEQQGWDRPQFDDARWEEASVCTAPECRLVAQICPPIRATRILEPHTIRELEPRRYVVDFGQNFAGWCRLRVTGMPGARIELHFAESLAASGELDQDSMRANFGFREPRGDVFILQGGTEEVLEPLFAYRGFRYVEVRGVETPLTHDCIRGIVIHTDLQITGDLRSGAPPIERLWRNTMWTQRSNFVGIPTDCPSREQRGWMGDAGIFWDAAAFNMDICTFTRRQMQNVIDDQAPDGALPAIAPEPREHILDFEIGSLPGWSDAALILAWTAWRRYGDTAVIENNWEAMSRYVGSICESNPDHVWRNRRSFDLGDWLALSENADPVSPTAAASTPKDLIATAYWAHSTNLLAQMAQAIDRVSDTERLRILFQRVRAAFNSAFVSADGVVGNDSQTSYILALKFDLLPDELRQRAAERLAANIRSRGISLTTGILGTQFSLDVLADAGFTDLAYDLLLRNEFPSWEYMSRNGATTIWENWSGEGAYGGKSRISQNHLALGAVCGFLFRRMAGIDALTPGFESILIRPLPDSRIEHGGADYESLVGKISTHWTWAPDETISLDVCIPANATARIHIPARPDCRIEESGENISRRSDMRVLARLDHEAVVELGSGTYRFTTAR